MQRLEAKISKAEADAQLEVTITVGDGPAAAPPTDGKAPRTTLSIPGAREAAHAAGRFIRTADRELEIDYDRWTPATLFVRIGNVTVFAQGSDEMIDRVVKETRWEMLAGLEPGPARR